MQIKYDSIAHLIEAAQEAGQPLSALVLEQQAQQTERSSQELYQEMERMYHVMKESAQEGMKEGLRSTSGLTRGSACRERKYPLRQDFFRGFGTGFGCF